MVNLKKLPINLLTASCFCFLSSCTTATIQVGENRVQFTRMMTSTSFNISPDGSVSYSSDPQAQAIGDLTHLLAKLLTLIETKGTLQ